jgi:hypothetical protein
MKNSKQHRQFLCIRQSQIIKIEGKFELIDILENGIKVKQIKRKIKWW